MSAEAPSTPLAEGNLHAEEELGELNPKLPISSFFKDHRGGTLKDNVQEILARKAEETLRSEQGMPTKSVMLNGSKFHRHPADGTCSYETINGSKVVLTPDILNSGIEIVSVDTSAKGQCTATLTNAVETAEEEIWFKAKNMTMTFVANPARAACFCYVHTATNLGFTKVDMKPWSDTSGFVRSPPGNDLLALNCSTFPDGPATWSNADRWTFFGRDTRAADLLWWRNHKCVYVPAYGPSGYPPGQYPHNIPKDGLRCVGHLLEAGIPLSSREYGSHANSVGVLPAGSAPGTGSTSSMATGVPPVSNAPVIGMTAAGFPSIAYGATGAGGLGFERMGYGSTAARLSQAFGENRDNGVVPVANIPAQWDQFWDRSAGLSYFVNRETGEKRWTPPNPFPTGGKDYSTYLPKTFWPKLYGDLYVDRAEAPTSALHGPGLPRSMVAMLSQVACPQAWEGSERGPVDPTLAILAAPRGIYRECILLVVALAFVGLVVTRRSCSHRRRSTGARLLPDGRARREPLMHL